MKYRLLLFFISFFLISSGQVNMVDDKGLKQGEWAKLYDGTRVYKYRGTFKDDKPIGKFYYYYKSSKLKAVINHKENSSHSEAYYYHENGTLMSHGIFKDQLKDSIWVNYTPSQRKSSSETYLNGKLNGKKIIYYIPDNIDDKSQIPSVIFTYKDNLLDGKYIEYFSDLSNKLIGKYKNNKKEGVWTSFQSNGKKSSLVRYKNGRRHGWCIGYDINGNEVSRKYYYLGELIKGKRLEELMDYMKSKRINPND